MDRPVFIVLEKGEPGGETFDCTILQKAVTTWLTNQLNTPTNDACAEVSAQAFEINSCVMTAYKAF